MAGRYSKLHKNTFNSGISKDLVDEASKSDVVREADNIDLVEHGDYLAPTNVKGTTSITQLVSGDYAGEVKFLKSENANIYLEDALTTVPGVVAFFAHRNGASTNDQLLVYFFARNSDDTHLFEKVYSETISGVYDGHVDSVAFGEGGFDYVYFTVKDGFLGTIKCSVNDDTPVQIPEKDIKLLKEESFSLITDIEVIDTVVSPEDSASLFTGSYMFAIRLLDNRTNSYTKWSLLTWPVQVTPTLDAAGFSEGVIGVSTTKKVTLTLDIDAAAVTATGYTHYQIGVIENIDGTTVPQVVAYLQDIEALTVSQSAYTYNYTSNSVVNQIPIDDIVTDLAQIASFNTINIKDNILFGADVTYKNLEYDRGDPVVGSVTYVLENSETISDSFRDDTFASTRRGYFRDEVYRFYITYYDEDYNFAFPKVLDFSSVSGAISDSGYDLKFPDRYNTSYGHISGTGEETYSLGVQFSDIVNHPTWAIGYVILRAKREKNILGQAALVPTMKVEPAFQRHGYPEFPNEDYPSGESDDTIEPANPLGTYVPKIFGGIVAKDIRRKIRLTTKLNPTYASQSGISSSSTDFREDSARKFLLYSPEYIHTSAGNPLGNINDLTGAQIEPVDAVLLNGARQTGDNNVSGGIENYTASTFYAYNTNDYYNADGRTLNRSTLQNRGIQKLREVQLVVEAGSAVTPLGTYGDQESMTLTGYVDGYIPVTQKAIVAVVDDPRLDIAYESMDTTVDTVQWRGYPTYKYGTAGLSKITSAGVVFDSNQFDKTGAATSALEIVNITKGLGDNRYGNKTKQWDAIYTGAGTRLASKGDITAVTADIWGGDCFVSKFTFKTSDRGYSLVNPLFADDLTDAATKTTAKDLWGTWFMTDANGATTYTQNQSRPIGVNALAEAVSIYIESEVNTSVDYKDTYRVATTTASSDSFTGSGSFTGTPNGISETWISINGAGLTNFTLVNDISVTGSPYGVFSGGTFYNTMVATSAFSNDEITLVGSAQWTTTGTGINRSHVLIEKVSAANVLISTIMSDLENHAPGLMELTHNFDLSSTLTLAIGEKLRFVFFCYDHDTTTFPSHVGGSFASALSTSASVIQPSSESEYLTPFSYRYHGGYSVENESKVFHAEPEGFIAVNKFRSRIIYSNQKIVNSDNTGFDSFPVLNFYDMEETYGKVTKLAKIKGELYSLQDTALAYLPIHANVMQTADGTSLSIRSADVIGIPKWITSSSGSTNIEAVVNDSDKLFFVDGQDSAIYTIGEAGVHNIADGRMESFFHENILDEDLTNIKLSFSNDHKEVYITRNTDFNYVYNTKLGVWKTNLGIRGTATEYKLGGVFTIDGIVYFVGQNDSNTNRLRIDKGYHDDTNRGYWFGTQAESSIEFNVNPENDLVKTADIFQVFSSSGLDSIEISTDNNFGNLSTGPVSLFGTDVEGLYKVKRFANILDKAGKVGQRIRGNTFDVKIVWDNEGKSTLKSVISKYRHSKRTI